MTKTLTLRSFDIPALHKFGIGFDNMFDDLMRVSTQQSTSNYPPYNIVQINDDEYMIAVAVAGFGHDNLSVTKDKKFLIIEGKHAVEKMWKSKIPLPFICTKALVKEVSAENSNLRIMWKSAMHILNLVF
jgi:HSP20 family molecular chaperone IbpA